MVLFVDANAMYNPFDFQQQTFRTDGRSADGRPTRAAKISSRSSSVGRKPRASSAKPRDSPLKNDSCGVDIGQGLMVCSEQWKASKGATATCDPEAVTSAGVSVSGVPPGVRAAAVSLGVAGRTPPRAPSGRVVQAHAAGKTPFVATVRPEQGAAQRGSGSAPPARSRQSGAPSRFNPPARRSAGSCAGETSETIAPASSQRHAPTRQPERRDAAPRTAQTLDGPTPASQAPSAAFATATPEAPSADTMLDLEDMLGKLRGLRAEARTGPDPKSFPIALQEDSDSGACEEDMLGKLRGLRAAARMGPQPQSHELVVQADIDSGSCDRVNFAHIGPVPDEDIDAHSSSLALELPFQAVDYPDAATHNHNVTASIDSDILRQHAELRVFLRRAGLEDLFVPITTQLASSLTELLAVPEANIRRLPWRGKGGQRLLSVLKTERGRRTISLDTEAQELMRGRELLRRSQSVERGSQHNAASNRRSVSCIPVGAELSAPEIAGSSPSSLQELLKDSSEHIVPDTPVAYSHPSWIGPTDDWTHEETLLEAPLAAALGAASADQSDLSPSRTATAERQAERRGGNRVEASAVVKGKKPPASTPAARFRPPSCGARRAPKQPARALVPRCAPGSTAQRTHSASGLHNVDGGDAPQPHEAPAETAPRASSQDVCPPPAPAREVSCEATCEVRCEAGRKSSRKAPCGSRSKTRKARIHELLRALDPCPFEVLRVADRQLQARDRHVHRRSPSPGVGPDASSSGRRPGRSLMELVAASAKEDAGAASPLELGHLIASLPTAPAAEGCGEICAICLEVPTCGEEVTSLPCFHAYHKECIHEWLVHSRQCPLCKGPAFAHGLEC